MSKPLSPEEASRIRLERRPEAVIEVFNELIADHFDGKEARILLSEVIAGLKDRGIDKDDAFAKHWLDVEPEFRREGWAVKYDSPSYGDENFAAYFVFSR